MKIIDDMQNKGIKIWNIIMSITLIEGIIAAIVLLSIKRDVKNVQFLGLSYSRLALIGFVFLLILLFTILLFKNSLRNNILSSIRTSSKNVDIIKRVALFFVFFLWYVVWIPSSRFGALESAFIRLQPILIWIGLIGAQTYVLIKLITGQLNFQGLLIKARENRKFITIFGALTILSVLIFYLLSYLPDQSASDILYFQPGAPLSGLQVFLCWSIFIFVFLAENNHGTEKFSRKLWTVIPFVVLLLVTFLLLATTPFPCTDDRPGPFPPNYVCYPQVNDAMYSIGSHYLALGQGMPNQDKPLFVIFLAIGQWLFGPIIDRYLFIQIIIFAFIPGLLFLYAKKQMGFSGGLFLAVLMILHSTYSILLYEKTGSMNAKLENPELFTAAFLIILCFLLFNWINMPHQKIWAVLSGGVLGLSILVRFNTVMIVPVILIVLLIANLKNKKMIISSLGLFILFVGITSLPGFFAQGNEGGGNFIIGKINTVINSRILPDSQSSDSSPSPVSENVISPTVQVSNYQGNSEEPIANSENSLDSQNATISDTMLGVSGVVSHFFNNYYSSLGNLPTELFFEPIRVQTSNKIWAVSERVPLWKVDFTFQNGLAMLFSLSLVIIGLITMGKKFGLAGFSPFIIQSGYFIGNAAAMTSGGRYLEPVFWVTLFYYAIGLYTLAIIVINFLRKENQIDGVTLSNQSGYGSGIAFHKTKYVIVAGVIILGLLPLLIVMIPDQIPVQSGVQVNQMAYEHLSENKAISDDEWRSFLSDPNSLVVQGQAYHPRYYRSGYFSSGNPRFELTVLSKDNVFISYFIDERAINYFSDGSDVILVGCQIDNKDEWYANLVIMKTYAIIQLDHEKDVYIAEDVLQACHVSK
jgi:hypothetical protein